MTDRIEDPCMEGQQPSPGPGPGDAVQPVPEYEVVEFDRPLFPELEVDFESLPSLRTITLLPRDLVFNSLRATRSSRRLGNSRARWWDSVTNPEVNYNNPADSSKFDIFRYLAGKTYMLEYGRPETNWFFNDTPGTSGCWQSAADVCNKFDSGGRFGQDFVINVWKTVGGECAPCPGEYPSMTQNVIKCFISNYNLNNTRGVQLTNDRSGDMIRDSFVKQMFPDMEDKGIDEWFTETAFKTPASYYMKEADGLNLRLPHITSMQVFIPDMVTYEEGEKSYDDLLPGPTEKATQKRSVYERYAMEFLNKIDDCQFLEDKVRTHKFPAEKVKLINEITDYVESPNLDGQFSAFRRIFRRNYDFYTRISFDLNNGENLSIASKLKELNLDTMILGMFDVDSPSNETLYAQAYNSQLELDPESQIVTNLNYRPNTYEGYIDSTSQNNDKFRQVLNPDHFRPGLQVDFSSDDLALILDPATYPLSYEGEDFWRQEHNSALDAWVPFYTIPALMNWVSFKQWILHEDRGFHHNYFKLMNNSLCYSEVVAYRLEKRDASTGEVVQNFYFFNDPDTKRVNFIDTQVLFGERYTYRIFSINAVVGMKYRYIRQTWDWWPEDDPTIVDDYGGLTWNGKVQQTPYISFIEAPYFEQELLITDAPPLSPDVWFLPVETLAEDLVWFWFTPRLGEELATPIPIFEEDMDIVENMRKVQNVTEFTGPDSLIRYKSDSNVAEYEILVLDEPPLSYQDFNLGRRDVTTSDSPSFKKRVTANKDYYITFRCKDFGGISNPTKVFRYRLSATGNSVPTHEIEEYEFQQETEEYLFSFDRIVSVEPSTEQRTVNFRESNDYAEHMDNHSDLLETTRGVSGLELGVGPNEKIWNKKFVVEITSAVTGKKVKIRTTFKQLAIGFNQSRYEVENPDQNSQFMLREGCFERERRNRYQANENRSNQRTAVSLQENPISTRAEYMSRAERLTPQERREMQDSDNDTGGNYNS